MSVIFTGVADFFYPPESPFITESDDEESRPSSSLSELFCSMFTHVEKEEEYDRDKDDIRIDKVYRNIRIRDFPRALEHATHIKYDDKLIPTLLEIERNALAHRYLETAYRTSLQLEKRMLKNCASESIDALFSRGTDIRKIRKLLLEHPDEEFRFSRIQEYAKKLTSVSDYEVLLSSISGEKREQARETAPPPVE